MLATQQVQTGVSVNGRGDREHMVVVPQVCTVEGVDTDSPSVIAEALCGQAVRLTHVGFDVDGTTACKRCAREATS